MLFPDTSDWEFNLLSIDPGSAHLGVAVYRVRFNTKELIESFAFTIEAKHSKDYLRDYSNQFGDKYARLTAMKNELYSVFDTYRPSLVICESPFFNSFTPNAFSILTELVNLIQMTLREFNNSIPFYKVDPPRAKKAVGAKGNAKKEEMTIAIDRFKETLKLNSSVELLDEHSIDALAIGYYGYIHYVLNLE